MKRRAFYYIFTVLVLCMSACKAQHSYNSVEGKKKLKHYNSIQYGQKPGRR